MVFVNYYEVLQVPSLATHQEIISAYRKLALKHHPDKSGVEEVENFLLIHKAYKVLCDPLLRREYDSKLQQQISYTASMKMTEKRVQLYERLHKKVSEEKKEQSYKTESKYEIPEDVAEKYPARNTIKKAQDFDEYERIILGRMKAG